MSEPKSTGRKPGHNASKKGFVASPPIKPVVPTPSKLAKDTSKKDIDDAVSLIHADSITKVNKPTKADVERLFGSVPNLTGGLSVEDYLKSIREESKEESEDEIVWTSKVTSDMTNALKDDTIDEFVNELNDCVMQLCIEFGVHGDQSTRATGSNNRRTIWSSTITRNMVSGLPSHMVEGVIEALNTDVQSICEEYEARIEKIDGRVLGS